MLERWESRGTFERLREQTRGGRTFSFIDGPVTANKTMGVHTAWGRTLKDVIQRFKAMQGFDQRYQNGFDCQGLWIEVGVEKQLGLNSKADIEAYGLEKFAAKCREVVVWSSGELTRASKRLGQWMDWGNDYFTFSDTNIEYIWRFLKEVDARGMLFKGHRAAEWCPRCGTSLSQHELSQAGVYQDRDDPSLFVRFALSDRPGEALVIWTTTPWTLPANVAAAVRPDMSYGRKRNGDWVSVHSAPDAEFVEVRPGAELVGWRYRSPFDGEFEATTVEHRTIPWSEIEESHGTGIVHIAPGAGREDFELSKVHDLPVLTPVDEAGRFYPQYGWLAGLDTGGAAEPAVEILRTRGALVRAGTIRHSYPHCWRCDTPLIFRLSDDWFIAVDPVREALLEQNATIAWTPEQYGKRMDDWLRNMGDWNISRRRFYGLPLPIYPCECGFTTVVGSRRELEQRAVSGIDELSELHRPWIDRVKIRCAACEAEVSRIQEVGDVWLDAGIVPFSTLGWRSGEHVEGGYATGASRGLSGADLPDHAYWQKWFPADWVTEMREQIRLWFYSQLFMSVVLTGRTPFRTVLTFEKLLDAGGREMHGSWGNLISADEAFERMGADVMRWLYCQQPPTQNIRFGYEPADEVKRRILTLWNCVRFFTDYARIEAFTPRLDDLDGIITGVELQPLDRWLLARTDQLVANAQSAYGQYRIVGAVDALDGFIDDLSNWYIRRSRRRFYGADDAAFRTLWTALVQCTRVMAPVLPFLAEYLWMVLVESPCEGAVDSVHLAGWPAHVAEHRDTALLAQIADVRRVVQLGRRARAESGVKLRQPLRAVHIRGAELARGHEGEIADELRVKEVAWDAGPVVVTQLLPNLPVVGKRLRDKVPQVRRALAAGEYEELDGGRIAVAGFVLEPEEVIRGDRVDIEGWALAEEGGVSIAIDTDVDAGLEREGRAFELIHRLNSMRKDAGLELTDRIDVVLPQADGAIVERFGDWIRSEVLAVALSTGDVTEPTIAGTARRDES